MTNTILEKKDYNQFISDLNSVNSCFQSIINRSENFLIKYGYNVVMILKPNNSLGCCTCEKWKKGGLNLGCIFVLIIKYSFEKENKQISNIVIGKLPSNPSLIEVKMINLDQFYRIYNKLSSLLDIIEDMKNFKFNQSTTSQIFNPDLCPICMERKANAVIRNCTVKLNSIHFVRYA